MNTHVFFITAKTNLHVGNENGNDFTIIDKAIQRDALTNLPSINSSSLKGAINEFCIHESTLTAKDRQILFGADKKKEEKEIQKGEAIFFDAKLLLLPQQDDSSLYHYVTSQSVLDQMNDRISLFGSNDEVSLDDIRVNKPKSLITDEELEACCSDDNLPIIARNVLENGLSKNLWYEQVLPAETVLYTIIREKDNKLRDALNGKLVQIGANATIGYGYCQFTLLKSIQNNKEV